MTARWRKPIDAHTEETGSATAETFREGWRPLVHWTNSEGAERIAAGYACWQCLTPFPAPVGPENLRAWKREAPEMFDWHPTLPAEVFEARVKAYCCPICDSECSPRMLREQLELTPGGPQRPGAPNYLTDSEIDKAQKRIDAVAGATRLKAPVR